MTIHTVGSEALYHGRPGGRIAYDVAGEGPLVVCVPGMGDLRSV
ncbi:MAG TPA: alpha/beta hydrolase, partial [Candidatus Dormibacteraeota bacterium]|nr:alpha/beta hydrolase [Candidatus Dormibacteraeota bacterium]